MLRAMVEMPPADTFLKSVLVNSAPVLSDKKEIELDKFVGKQGVAVYNSRVGQPTEVGKKGYTTDLHVSPYVNENITMTPQDFDTRQPGDNIYDASPQADRAAKTTMYLSDLNARLDRLEEKQIAEAITSGTVTVQNAAAGVDYTVDYQMSANNQATLSGGNVWGGASSDIIGNLETWGQRLSNKGYVAADLIMDINAATLFRKDTEILNYLDNRRVEMGDLSPRRLAGQRASYLGTLSAVGINIDCWAYMGVYETADDTFSPYLDANRAILVGAGAEVEQHYGKIENFKTSFRGRRFPNMWEENNGKVRYIGMESAPLAVLRNPNSIFSAKVVS
jgi:hypothetical protein